MRDFIFLVVVSIGVVGGVAWYMLPGPARNLFRTTIALKVPNPPAEAVKETKPAVKPHKSAVSPKLEITALKPASALRSELVVPVAYAPKPEIPAAGEVKIGSDRSRLIDSFGSPSLSASTADRGHVFETFVYKRNLKQAVIRLEDGRVSSVYVR